MGSLLASPLHTWVGLLTTMLMGFRGVVASPKHRKTVSTIVLFPVAICTKTYDFVGIEKTGQYFMKV